MLFARYGVVVCGLSVFMFVDSVRHALLMHCWLPAARWLLWGPATHSFVRRKKNTQSHNDARALVRFHVDANVRNSPTKSVMMECADGCVFRIRKQT